MYIAMTSFNISVASELIKTDPLKCSVVGRLQASIGTTSRPSLFCLQLPEYIRHHQQRCTSSRQGLHLVLSTSILSSRIVVSIVSLLSKYPMWLILFICDTSKYKC